MPSPGLNLISDLTENEIQTPENHFRRARKWNSDPGKPFLTCPEMKFRPRETISDLPGSGIQTRERHFRRARKWNSDPGKAFPTYPEMEFRSGRGFSRLLGIGRSAVGGIFRFSGKHLL